MLRVTQDCGTRSVVDEVFDWDDNLPAMVSDAEYGGHSFTEFVGEGLSGESANAAEVHTMWLEHVLWRDQVETWLRGDTKLREDFYLIGTE